MAELELSSFTDWSKCILCLETTAETLQSLGNTRRSDIDSVCITSFPILANNILRFYFSSAVWSGKSRNRWLVLESFPCVSYTPRPSGNS